MLKNNVIIKFFNNYKSCSNSSNKSNISCLLTIQNFNFRTKEDITKLNNISERNKRKDNLYCPKQVLIFQDEGRLSLINTTASNYIRILKREEVIIGSVFFITVSLSFGLVYYGFYKSALLTSAITLYTIRGFRNVYMNSSRVVSGFNLLEDGKSVEVVTLKKKFITNIKLLAKPTKQQMQVLNMYNPEFANISTPFIVDKGEHKGYYFVPPDVDYELNKELIGAVMNNSYIDVSNRIGYNQRITWKE